MKEQLLEIALRYVDNTKEANDLVSELLLLYSVMLSLPSGDELQEFINKSEARRTFQGTPCFAQERLAFDSAVRETIKRLRERGNGA